MFLTQAELPAAEWPYSIAGQRLALALTLGMFVGLERQRRGKEAGGRPFAFVGLIGCLAIPLDSRPRHGV